ncbi:MAG: serine/threonine protein kinase [Myxococcota bacterium]|nr:serine/threonine protein kinase [Myxococcota bacterium]
MQNPLQAAAGLREGDLLAGKYRVERVVGAGGMGVVIAAHHIGLDEKVAIKFLLPDMVGNAAAMRRFAREARNAVKIKSEHMARVFDVGTLETGAPYMVMEFLEGGDLHNWIQQRGPLAFEQAVDFVLQACEAIAEAHALGIVHRDLKPANLFCVRRADGRLSIKVIDFGISKVTHLGGSFSEIAMYGTSEFMGSPFYMSPEQLEATHAVDARADIWAMGVILQELVTGTVPFPGETLPEVSFKIVSHRPLLLREFRPDAPDGLQAVVSRCLEKDRERRYRNVAELALALRAFGPEHAKASVERITDIIQTAGLTDPSLSSPSVPSSNKGGKKAVVGLVAATGIVALAAMVAFALGVTRKGPHMEAEHRATSSSNVAEGHSTPVLPRPSSASTVPLVETVLLAPEGSPAPINQGGQTVSVRLAAPTRPDPRPAGMAAPTATTTAKPDCSPPTFVDPRGDIRFKPECFGVPAHSSSPGSSS